MKHVMKLDRNRHLLNVQYRCERSILAFSNEQFYENRIRTDSSVVCRKPEIKKPLLFIDAHGDEENEGEYISAQE